MKFNSSDLEEAIQYMQSASTDINLANETLKEAYDGLVGGIKKAVDKISVENGEAEISFAKKVSNNMEDLYSKLTAAKVEETANIGTLNLEGLSSILKSSQEENSTIEIANPYSESSGIASIGGEEILDALNNDGYSKTDYEIDNMINRFGEYNKETYEQEISELYPNANAETTNSARKYFEQEQYRMAILTLETEKLQQEKEQMEMKITPEIETLRGERGQIYAEYSKTEGYQRVINYNTQIETLGFATETPSETDFALYEEYQSRLKEIDNKIAIKEQSLIDYDDQIDTCNRIMRQAKYDDIELLIGTKEYNEIVTKPKELGMGFVDYLLNIITNGGSIDEATAWATLTPAELEMRMKTYLQEMGYNYNEDYMTSGNVIAILEALYEDDGIWVMAAANGLYGESVYNEETGKWENKISDNDKTRENLMHMFNITEEGVADQFGKTYAWMTAEEIDNLYYLYGTAPQRAREYLNDLEDDINLRIGSKWATDLWITLFDIKNKYDNKVTEDELRETLQERGLPDLDDEDIATCVEICNNNLATVAEQVLMYSTVFANASKYTGVPFYNLYHINNDNGALSQFEYNQMFEGCLENADDANTKLYLDPNYGLCCMIDGKTSQPNFDETTKEILESRIKEGREITLKDGYLLEGNITEDQYKIFNFLNLVSADDDYKGATTEKERSNLRFAGQVAQGFFSELPFAIPTMLTGGGGGLAAQIVRTGVAFLRFGSGYASAKNKSLHEGIDIGEARTRAAISASWEAFSEWALGGIEDFGANSKWLADLLKGASAILGQKNPVLGTVLNSRVIAGVMNFASSALQEGAEEIIQGLGSNQMDKILNQAFGRYNGVENYTLEQAIEEGTQGFWVAALLNAAHMPAGYIHSSITTGNIEADINLNSKQNGNGFSVADGMLGNQQLTIEQMSIISQAQNATSAEAQNVINAAREVSQGGDVSKLNQAIEVYSKNNPQFLTNTDPIVDYVKKEINQLVSIPKGITNTINNAKLKFIATLCTTINQLNGFASSANQSNETKTAFAKMAESLKTRLFDFLVPTASAESDVEPIIIDEVDSLIKNVSENSKTPFSTDDNIKTDSVIDRNTLTGLSSDLISVIDYMNLDKSNQENFLKNASIEQLLNIVMSLNFTTEFNSIWEGKIIASQDYVTSIIFSDSSDSSKTLQLMKFMENNTEILKNLSNQNLIALLAYGNRRDSNNLIIKEIVNRLNNGDCVFDVNNVTVSVRSRPKNITMSAINNLPPEVYQQVITMGRSILNNRPQYLLDAGFDGRTFADLNLVSLVLQGKLNEFSIKILSDIIAQNPNALNNFYYEILNPNIVSQLGVDYVSDIGKYYELASKVVSLYNNNPKVFNAYVEIIKNQTDNSLNIDKIIGQACLNFFAQNASLLEGLDSTVLTSQEFLNYILFQTYSFTTDANQSKISIDFSKNYQQQFDYECDQIFLANVNAEGGLQLAIDAMLQKYYSITLDEAKAILKRSYTHINELINQSGMPDAKAFFDLLNLIVNIEDSETAIKLYKNLENAGIRITSEEMLYWDKTIKEAYAKTYVDSLTATETSLNEAKNSSNLEMVYYNGTPVEVINYDGDFSFLVYSSDTGYFGKKELVNDNYVDTWNAVSNIRTSGLSTSYITSDNIGSAPVYGTGVLYAFTGIQESQFGIMAPYDVKSKISEYVIGSLNQQMFIPSSTMSENTTRVYNEIVLERKGVTPDYIILYSDASSEATSSAYKAASQWKIPVIKIDKQNLAERQQVKIENCLAEFQTTGDVGKLTDAMDLYESNISGYKFNSEPTTQNDVTKNVDHSSVQGILKGDIIETVVYDFINQLEQTGNKQSAIELKEALENIKERYDFANKEGSFDISRTKAGLNIDELIDKVSNIIEN